MKIAFYAPLKPPDHPTPSGDRRIARLLLEALKLGGHEVSLASRLRSRDAGGEQMRQARIADLGQRLAARLLKRYSRSGNPPDLWLTYHLYYKAPDWIGPLVSAALGIPYVVVEASHAPKRAGGAWDISHRAVEQAVQGAARVICLNPNDRACLEPLASGRISTIAPFLNAHPYRSAHSIRDELSRTYGMPNGVPWLLAVGMMRHGDKLASYRMLADALRPLTDRAWRLVVAGDGAAAAEVRGAFSSLGNRIAWLGAVDESRLASVYKSVDALTWPAVREAFGMALLEAQAAGLPVIAGNTDGVPAIVRDGETGLLPQPGDTAAFTAAIAQLLADGHRREAMGLAARDRVLRHHSLESAARRLDDILQDALCHFSA
jgi:glycosyltransferase involved in cell wall biosynthesis